MTDEHPDADDGILSPDDLDRRDEHLTPLGDNRYVVATDDAESSSDEQNDGGASTHLDSISARYAVDLTAKTERGIARYEVQSDDIREVFADMLRWYTARLDPDLPPEVVIEILLSSSDLDA